MVKRFSELALNKLRNIIAGSQGIMDVYATGDLLRPMSVKRREGVAVEVPPGELVDGMSSSITASVIKAVADKLIAGELLTVKKGGKFYRLIAVEIDDNNNG